MSNDGPSEKVLCQICRKLFSLIENYIIEQVRSPSLEIKNCYLKNIFPNTLSNTSLDFISDIVVNDHKHYN